MALCTASAIKSSHFLFLLLFPMAFARIFSKRFYCMFNSENRNPCLGPVFNGKEFKVSPLSMIFMKDCGKRSSHMCAQSLQFCLILCDPMDCSPPGFSVHRILQARILKWVVISSARATSLPRDQTRVSYVSCIARRVVYHRDRFVS